MIDRENREDIFIPLSEPFLAGNEWIYVKECLDTGWVSTAGKFVDRFEEEIRRLTGAKHAVACVNGTAALQVALRIAGVRRGDEVIVPTVTFISPINAVRYLDAEPVFMDCDEFYNLDSLKTLEFVKEETVFREGASYNKRTGRKISALIAVHVFGNAVYLDDLISICQENRIRVIEDAAESLGTRYTRTRFAGKHTGTVGELGCLSFNGNKIITTGGGGMILTDSEDHAEKARYLTTQAKDDKVRYIHNEVGYNFRLTNLQAALGVAQLEQLPDYLEKKKQNYEYYKAAVDRIPGLHLAETPPYAENNHWMYALQVDSSLYCRDREGLMKHLASQGVQSRPLWQLNHLQKPYRRCPHYRIENAVRLLAQTLNLPCSVPLTIRQMDLVIRSLK